MSNIKKLKSTPGDYLGRNCGLTPTSKFKLSGELQRLHQSLRLLFESDYPDLTKAKDIVLTFRSLELYVDINEDLVKRHVDKAKNEVNTNWTERKYRALNDNITDLKLMEHKFKSYPEISPASWNTGIIKNIEDEIDSLGHKAREYLRDHETARSEMPEFRRCFITMGFVLVELSPFKEYTKTVMCDVLEACLGHDWGYSYLFDCGLALRKSDEDTSEEESLVAQVILSEFSHFKEVLTMVWNEETSQKPVEVTVEDIRGILRRSDSTQTLQIEKDLLLNSFTLFEGEYKALLGEYIGPEADLNELCSENYLFCR
jgi:hypothetical protein